MKEFQVRSPSGSLSATTIEVAELDPKIIKKRFVKQVGGSLGAAVVSIFLPIAHFVLVPTFVGLSFFLGRRALRGKFQFGKAQINCPQCHREFSKDPSIDSIPLTVHCQFCNVPLALSATKQAGS